MPGSETSPGREDMEQYEAPAYLGRERPGRHTPYSVAPRLYGLGFLFLFALMGTAICFFNGYVVGFAVTFALLLGTLALGFFAVRKQVRDSMGGASRRYDR